MAITKTDFMRGMQCPKMLWLDKHKPGLKVIPPEIQERLDEGNSDYEDALEEDMEAGLASAMRTRLGIGPKIHLVPPKTITRSEGKAVRVIDNRKLHD